MFDRHLGPGVAAWPEASFLAAGAASTPAPAARIRTGVGYPASGEEVTYVTRRYRRESAEVVSDATGAPHGFRWRRRRYEVRAVLAHWVEALPWWRDSWSRSGGGGQRSCWRVEAISPTGEFGVYDLSVSGPAPGAEVRWVVDRVLD